MQKNPLLTMTIAAATLIAGNRFVTLAGAYPDAGGTAFGVSDTDADDGDVLAVDVIGTSKITSGGAFAIGDLLESDATGRAVIDAGGTVLAQALQAASGEGQTVEVLLKLA